MQGGLGAVTRGKEVLLFCQIKNKGKFLLGIARSKDGLKFILDKKKVSIISQTGKAETAKNCSDFYFTQNEKGEFVLYFKLLSRKKHYYCLAVSKTLLRWKIKQKSAKPLEREVFVPGYKFKRQMVKYSGKGSVYSSLYKTSKKKSFWERTGAPVLEPRSGYFDDSAPEIVNATAAKEGILLTYLIRNRQRGRDVYEVGAALCDKNQPDRVIWRSPVPVWEQPEEWDTKDIYPLGVVSFKNDILFYWGNKKGNILSAQWPIADSLRRFATGESYPRLERYAENPILKPNSKNWWETKAAMNAAAVYLGGRIHLLYRAIGDTDVSVLGYASSENGIYFDEKIKSPTYVPREDFEGADHRRTYFAPLPYNPYMSGGGGSGGCEDPRLTQIDDILYMVYVAFNGYSAPGVALTSIKTQDFLDKKWIWKKPRLISLPGKIEKNWVIFPEKINGKYAILHSMAPKISIDYFDDLEDEKIRIVSCRYNIGNEKRWDNIVRGVGAPPIKTDKGWLLFYHAMDKRDPNKYKIGAMILDYKDPTKILHRSHQPILEPKEKYENEGYKSGVVYVCGAVVKDNDLFVYYGGADTVMCVATAKLDVFLEKLTTGQKVKLNNINEVKILK